MFLKTGMIIVYDASMILLRATVLAFEYGNTAHVLLALAALSDCFFTLMRM